MQLLEQWQGRTALVVDDSASARELLAGFLAELGFAQVLRAEDGRDALEVLKATTLIDFILTDLNMPVMDGFALLGVLERERIFSHGHIAVMSSMEQELLDAVRAIAELGTLEIVDVIPKPITPDKLCLLLETLYPGSPVGCPPVSTLPRLAEAEFSAALANGELVSFFQPKVRVSDRQVVGVEALARWRHPVCGLVSPVHFVHFVESGTLGLNFLLSQLRECLAMLQRSDALGHALTVNINLPVPLLGMNDLVEQMTVACRTFQISPQRITVEVTETSIMSNISEALATLARLRLRGFGIAMDDYGTGYSSMKQLARCPFTELKIDRAFVHEAANNAKRLAILSSAVTMGKKLNLTLVAEGVETEADWQQIAAVECTLAQGYLIAKPMPEHDLIAFMQGQVGSSKAGS